MYSSQPDGLGSVPISTSTSTPTTAILLVALGILIIAVVLSIIGVVIVCRKSQPLNRREERARQSERTKLTLTGNNVTINLVYIICTLLSYVCTTCQGIHCTYMYVCARKHAGTNDIEETCWQEPTLQKNPAYYQGTILQMSSSNQAHDYETPLIFQAEENYIVMSSHEYDIPRKLHEYQSHDYEEV